MSYIRCLSNPDGLYAFINVEGFAEISWGPKPPFACRDFQKTGKPMRVPVRVFENVARKWADGWQDRVSFKGFTAEEIHIYEKTGKVMPGDLKKYLSEFKRGVKTRFVVKLSYKRDWVYLWRVTWEYVARNIQDSYVNDKKWRRRKR